MIEDITVFSGCIIHCPRPFEVEIINNGYLVVQGKKITRLSETEPPELQNPNVKLITLSKGQFLMPGMIDTHIHAPQYPNMGLGYDKPLLDWLLCYTFPLEAKYSNIEFAKNVYSRVVERSLLSGTTTASYFATVHYESSIALVDIVCEKGQRAFVGKVNMHRLAPDDLREKSVDELHSTTKDFIVAVLNKKNDLVQPTITPRFALSCDESSLDCLGKLAKMYNLNIQSHISENKDEITETLKLYMQSTSYADVYNCANLLTSKTIMAHAIHLTQLEMELMAKTGTSIAHCPTSNTLLRSGLCDVRELIEKGITVGLGTDVAGGSSLSIIDVMKAAIETSIHISYKKENYTPLDYKEVFYLATLGGARALSLEDKIGNFAKGKEFDALVIDMEAFNSSLLTDCSSEELLQKFVFTGDDRNINRIFVGGKSLK